MGMVARGASRGMENIPTPLNGWGYWKAGWSEDLGIRACGTISQRLPIGWRWQGGPLKASKE